MFNTETICTVITFYFNRKLKKKNNTVIFIVLLVTGDADCIDSYPSNWTGLYGGRKNTTVTGKICKLWSDTNHNTYGQLNYCRAPGGDQESRKGPWCYLQDEEGWEFCFIPLCSEYSIFF